MTRAASRLHLTQPPLTAQLSRLERELGVPLLIRHRRGVDLTDAGRHLSTQARRLLAEVDALAASVRQLGEGRSGRLALAFDSATAWTLLPQLLERFRVDRPDVVLDVSEETADGVLDAVRLRRTELGLVHLPPPTVARTRDPQLDFAVVHREPLVAVLPAALATQHGERADLAALAAQQFLAPAPGASGGLHRHLVEACRQAGFEPNVREVKLVPTVVALIGAGLGVSRPRPATNRPPSTPRLHRREILLPQRDSIQRRSASSHRPRRGSSRVGVAQSPTPRRLQRGHVALRLPGQSRRRRRR